MAWNPLDWLLSGKLDQQPAPISVGPELRAYDPRPSESFEGWLSGLLGAGPGASVAKQNFATGVPKLLEMTPLGIGLSAADLLHAKRANDPLGAAAAVIGMVPGVGNLGRSVVPKPKASSADATEAALKAIEEILGPAPVHVPGPGTPYLMGGPANPTNMGNMSIEEVNKAAKTALENWGTVAPPPKNMTAPPAGWEPMPKQTSMSADWLHPDDFKFENGQWLQKVGLPATKKAGQISEAAPPVKKPVLDYEKDDNGLYHIFDAVSGKTINVVDSHKQAKDWIAAQEGVVKPPPTSIPIKVSQGNEHVFDRLGVFPKSVPFQAPPQAIEHGYVTPAVHGTKLAPSGWATPTKEATVGGVGDALRLPSDELGVHFGTPDQAKDFTGRIVGGGYAPRTYPTVLQTGRSLELPDMGTWHVDRIKDALERLNKGTGYGVGHGKYTVKDPYAHVGTFPKEELEKITDIGQMREYLQKKGFDSVNYINTVESPGHTSHIMFKSSPEVPSFVAGVRSPFAAFDPSKAMRPELAYSIAALLGLPALMPQEEKK